MCAVQVACLCAERPTDAQFAGALCEEQITCANSVGALGVCGVGFACAHVLDVPRLLMFAGTVAVTNICYFVWSLEIQILYLHFLCSGWKILMGFSVGSKVVFWGNLRQSVQ